MSEWHAMNSKLKLQHNRANSQKMKKMIKPRCLKIESLNIIIPIKSIEIKVKMDLKTTKTGRNMKICDFPGCFWIMAFLQKLFHLQAFEFPYAQISDLALNRSNWIFSVHNLMASPGYHYFVQTFETNRSNFIRQSTHLFKIEPFLSILGAEKEDRRSSSYSCSSQFGHIYDNISSANP